MACDRNLLGSVRTFKKDHDDVLITSPDHLVRLHLSSCAVGRKDIFGTLELNMSLKMEEQFNFRK